MSQRKDGVMQRMSILALLVAIGIMTGCSGVSNVSYPMSDGTYRNQRTVSDPHAFAPTHSRSWLETCKAKPGTQEPDYTNCVETVDPRYATTSGYLDGMGASMVQAGAIVGGSYLIGQGLKGSRSTITQEGGGASQSQDQDQGQRQEQRITPPPRHR